MLATLTTLNVPAPAVDETLKVATLLTLAATPTAEDDAEDEAKIDRLFLFTRRPWRAVVLEELLLLLLLSLAEEGAGDDS